MHARLCGSAGWRLILAGLTNRFAMMPFSLSPLRACCAAALLTFSHTQFFAQTTWTGGGTNESWDLVDNWDNGLPAAGNDAYIPAGVIFCTFVSGTTDYDIVVDGQISILNMTVGSGHSLTINGVVFVNTELVVAAGATFEHYGNWVAANPGMQLQLHGTLNNYGTISPQGSDIQLFFNDGSVFNNYNTVNWLAGGYQGHANAQVNILAGSVWSGPTNPTLLTALGDWNIDGDWQGAGAYLDGTVDVGPSAMLSAPLRVGGFAPTTFTVPQPTVFNDLVIGQTVTFVNTLEHTTEGFEVLGDFTNAVNGVLQVNGSCDMVSGSFTNNGVMALAPTASGFINTGVAVNNGTWYNCGNTLGWWNITGNPLLSGGCTDPTASNYEPYAPCDNGSCIAGILGCTDAGACNYDPTANVDDGSCEFLSCAGCTDAGACNYDATATLDDGSCEFISCAGCTEPVACNYDATATIEDGSCEFSSCQGCTYPDACNYDAAAHIDNGTCTMPGCTDAGAANYNASAGCDDGSCIFVAPGDCATDLNNDGETSTGDLLVVLADFGTTCP